jgi:hypothetical protein
MFSSRVNRFAIRTTVFYARCLGGNAGIISVCAAGGIAYAGVIILALNTELFPASADSLPPSILAVRTRAIYADPVPAGTFPVIFMALPFPVYTACACFSANPYTLSACAFCPDACFAIVSKLLILAGAGFLSLATSIRISHVIPVIAFITR